MQSTKNMKANIFIAFLATALLASSCKFQFDDKEERTPSKDPIHKLLTGNNSKGKTWRPTGGPYELGVGPKSTLTPDYFDFPYGVDTDPYVYGMLQNRFTFSVDNKFVPKNTTTTAHWAYANRYFGLNQEQFIDAAVDDPNLKPATFILKDEHTGIGTGYTVEITGGSYIGRFDKRHKYQIMTITEDTLKLRHLLSDDAYADPSLDELAWYSTYVRE